MSIFSDVPINKPKLNKFNLTHTKHLTFNMGDLIPIYVDEVLPGDIFRYNLEHLIRLMPLATPVFEMLDVVVDCFFVPNRIVMEDWNSFITGGEDQEDETNYPMFSFSGADDDLYDTMVQGTLYDYMGLPLPVDTEDIYLEFSQLPFRGYQRIWNEYYRDVDLQDELDIPIDSVNITSVSSTDKATLMTLRQRNKRKDYFTSARPEAQKGEEVGIPVDFVYLDTATIHSTDAEALEDAGQLVVNSSDGTNGIIGVTGSAGSPDTVRIENLEDEGVSVNINELRNAVVLQQYYELMSRIGGRINEWLLGVFGVKSQDSRLQRPEYLGGARTPISVSEVLQTSETSGDPLGTYAGHGVSAGSKAGFKFRAPEHGFIFVLMSVIPGQGYSQGMDKMWSRSDRFDYYHPQFANLGEQEITMRELYYDTDNSAGNNDTVFGYAPRYAEYKWKRNMVHGEMRGTMNNWHMQEELASVPTLNSTFIQFDNATLRRCFADTSDSTHKLYAQVLNKVSALRPMPYYGIPGISRI